ncbi:hypothetical protein AXA44_08315 [Rhodococcus sp. SC4]|nr:hypothetical protein AXA44_08315 [Rhodococcus sp. SC4]
MTGAGGLGQFAIKYLSALTPARIVAVDIDASKREHALTIGASMAVDSSSDEAVRQLLDVSGDGLGVDAVIDFVGVDSTLPLVLAAGVLAPRGALVLVGIGGYLSFGYTSPNQEVQVSTSSLQSHADLAAVISLWKRTRNQRRRHALQS